VGVWRRVEGKTKEGSGRFGDVDRHNMDAAAPDRSDSGGHDGRATNRGGRRGASDAGAAS
jgi:hypothetical protein